LAASAGVPLWHDAFSMHDTLKEQNDSVTVRSEPVKAWPMCPTSAMRNESRARSSAPVGPKWRTITTPTSPNTEWVQRSPLTAFVS
jgi:hypothetical protein